jgi:amino acid permease
MEIYKIILGILIIIFGVLVIILANKSTRTKNNFGNILKIYTGGFLAIILGIAIIINEINKIL